MCVFCRQHLAGCAPWAGDLLEDAPVGAWDMGPFGNDDALDFVGKLADLAGPERAQQLLAALALPHGFVEAPRASEAVAAAALVAAGNGMPVPVVEELFRSGTVPVDDHARARARAALSRVTGEESEWRELWEEAGLLAGVTGVLESIRRYL
jgi:hypothetical protein